MRTIHRRERTINKKVFKELKSGKFQLRLNYFPFRLFCIRLDSIRSLEIDLYIFISFYHSHSRSDPIRDPKPYFSPSFQDTRANHNQIGFY